MSDLLQQFLAEECTADVRQLLEDAIAGTAMARLHFDFNRYEMTSPSGVRSYRDEEILSNKTQAR